MKYKINAYIEIPYDSNIKYEYDFKNNKIVVDRILSGSNKYPCNYGFIDNTMDYDGDPLDILVFPKVKLLPGCVVTVRIIGYMGMIDQGEVDNKLIAVIDDCFEMSHINDINDISDSEKAKIKHFFSTYKLLENKKVEVNNFYNRDSAIKILKESQELYSKFEEEINSLSKEKYKKLLIKN